MVPPVKSSFIKLILATRPLPIPVRSHTALLCRRFVDVWQWAASDVQEIEKLFPMVTEVQTSGTSVNVERVDKLVIQPGTLWHEPKVTTNFSLL